MPSLRCPNCFYATSVKKDEVQGVVCQRCEYDLYHYYYTGRDEASVLNFMAEENKRLKKEKGRADRAALKEQTSFPKPVEPKSSARRWFKVAGYLLLLIVALRVVGVHEYINDYRAKKALAEKMEQGGFVDLMVYYKAQSLNIPTKALYDKHLKEHEEFLASLKEKADARAEREEKRKAELAAAVIKEGYQFTSGRIDTAIFCGTQREGFEIFIADKTGDFKFRLNTITPRIEKSPTFGMEPTKINGLVVPIRNGKPRYNAISHHPVVKVTEVYYHLYMSKYLNLFDHGPLGVGETKVPPEYKIYRDGSRLETILTSEFFPHHPDSTPSSIPLYGCKPITNTSLEELIGERLKGFGKLMEVKWQPLAAEIKARKDATKF